MKTSNLPQSTGRAGARPLFLCAVLLCLLSSCIGSDELMQAPRPAAVYQELQNLIDKLMAGGYTYSAPSTGDYRQAVQLYDLTGDGREDAILFLRGETENQMIVFLLESGGYVALPPVTEVAESVHSIAFSDFNGDGQQEIVVGWQIAGLRSVSVYSLEGGVITEILSNPYTGYVVCDIEGVGRPSLMLIQIDTTLNTGYVEMYAEREGTLVSSGTAPLSNGVKSLSRIRTDRLTDGRPCLMLASGYLESGEVTDIFAYRSGNLINITLNEETGVSDTLVRQISIAAFDVNKDGFVELPRPVELPRHPEADEAGSDLFYEIHWSAYSSDGTSSELARTYHSLRNDWYILLPEQWPEHYTVRRESPAAGQTVTTFSILPDDGGNPVDFLKIYHIARSAGDAAQTLGRTVLADQPSLLVLAELIPLRNNAYLITDTELKALFDLIPVDWRVGA